MKNLITTASFLVLITLVLELRSGELPDFGLSNYPTAVHGTQPLVMKGGDPYIRALMRTITASEANSKSPYSLIYGGQYISNLKRHPELCVPIVAGPNVGQCTTAAGRYQFINTTWYDKAQQYHPQPSGFLFWKSYSFEPQYQDAVVHAWLSDQQAWGMNLSEKLQQGKVDEVLRRLSGTWTSLGYGIEDNVMTKHLPRIYRQMLKEELAKAV
ncbi:glycoside hydrolase family 24 protein [Lyngbya aestuarii]|uniref:glycoside hydrolase family 24 protein n=1 Tax=Lyngbya aestuarii TaxID=118322 RepID=UPI00403D915A